MAYLPLVCIHKGCGNQIGNIYSLDSFLWGYCTIIHIPDNPTHIPDKPAYIPPNPTHIPANPTHIPAKPAYIPPNLIHIPSNPTHIPSNPSVDSFDIISIIVVMPTLRIYFSKFF